MKGKEAVRKPEELQTAADLTQACRWCEAQEEDLAGRIIIYPDTFNPALWIQRGTAFLWSKQVRQNEDGTCDSPYLSVLETRCRNHCSAQMLDYGPAIHVADVAVHVAGELLEEAESKARAAAERSGEAVTVDESAIGALDAEDRAAVIAHDAGVQTAQRRARADGLAKDRDEMRALLDRAQRVRALLVDGCMQHMARCQHVYRDQALRHLRFSHRKAHLRSPYLLPGALQELPRISLLDSEGGGSR